MNLRLYIYALAWGAIAMSLPGCYYDNEEELYPNSVCDTLNVSYTETVYPIIAENCISCHSDALQTAGISLEGYQNVKAQADNGNLLGVISHSPGYPNMPQGQPKLPECDIAQIRVWIENGAAQD